MKYNKEFTTMTIVSILLGIVILGGSGYFIKNKYGSNTVCAKEGELNDGGKVINGKTCCKDLKLFDIAPQSPPDKNYLCVNGAKGTPVCKMIGTEKEGVYYSESNILIYLGKCS